MQTLSGKNKKACVKQINSVMSSVYIGKNNNNKLVNDCHLLRLC